MNLLTDDPTTGNATTPQDYQSLSSGWALGPAAESAWEMGGFSSIERSTEQYQARRGEPTRAGTYVFRPGTETPELAPDAANETYGIAGQLSWDKPVREGEAKLLNQWKRDELARNDVLSRSTPGAVPAVARFLSGMAASVIDPVNIATSFIPVFGEARWAAMAGKVGNFTARIARGAAEGLVGSAAVEPLTAVQQINQQGDYTSEDAVFDIGFGIIGGAGLHVLGGAFVDALTRWRGAPMEARAAAVTHSMDALTEGRPVRAAEITEPARLADLAKRESLMGSTALSGADPAIMVPAGSVTAEAAPTGAGTTFKTAMGSTYTVHDDGTTTRVKAARDTPGHEGDSGPKARTEATYYVDSGKAAELTGAGLHGLGEKGARVAIKDGKATFLTWNDKEGKWGTTPDQRDIPLHTSPAVGREPLELWGKKNDVPGYDAFSKQHAGNPITEVTSISVAPRGDPTAAAPNPFGRTLDDMLAETMGTIRRDASPTEGGASADAVATESSRRADASNAESVPVERMPDEAKVRAQEAEASFRALVKDAESRGEKLATADVDAEVEKAALYQNLKKAASLMADCVVSHGV